MSEQLATPITKLFGIKTPILLAGMNQAAGPECAAAVTNAGGLGVIGGVSYTPKMLRAAIKDLKSFLNDKNAPFGVDLLLPQVGGSARKTNKDYTGGKLPELVDIIIEEKATLFVSAVGVPPKWAIDKFHAAGILCMNMIGAPKHALKALDVGVDIICAQGGEGGGHTGDISTAILIPKVVDTVRGRKSPLTGEQVQVVAAGGIFDGRGVAAMLSYGASAVWVGTRFVACKEAGAPPNHQQSVLTAGLNDTIRTIIYTGRPMRVRKTEYINDWHENKSQEIKDLTSKGILPVQHDVEQRAKAGEEFDMKMRMRVTPLLMGQVAGAINDVPSAKDIVDEMTTTAISIIKSNQNFVAKL